MRTPDSLTTIEMARLADFSEARAYEALVECAALQGDPTFDTALIGSAIALRSRSVRSSVLFNRVIGLGLCEEATEQMLDEAAALYAADRIPWGLELSPAARPDGLPELLRKRRMRRGLATALLIRSCAEVPKVETTFRIERTGPECGNLFGEISEKIFGVSKEVRRLLEGVAARPQFRQWIAFENDVPVASCLSHVTEDVAWGGWSSTLPAYRGKGIQSAFTALRIRDAQEAGCKWFTAETSMGTPASPDPSLRNLLRLGFSVAYERHTYIALPR